MAHELGRGTWTQDLETIRRMEEIRRMEAQARMRPPELMEQDAEWLLREAERIQIEKRFKKPSKTAELLKKRNEACKYGSYADEDGYCPMCGKNHLHNEKKNQPHIPQAASGLKPADYKQGACTWMADEIESPLDLMTDELWVN